MRAGQVHCVCQVKYWINLFLLRIHINEYKDFAIKMKNEGEK